MLEILCNFFSKEFKFFIEEYVVLLRLEGNGFSLLFKLDINFFVFSIKFLLFFIDLFILLSESLMSFLFMLFLKDNLFVLLVIYIFVGLGLVLVLIIWEGILLIVDLE